MKSILMILALIGIGFGLYIYFDKPIVVPSLTFKDIDGNPVALTDMMQGKQNLLVVFITGKECPMSKFSIEMINEKLPDYSSNLAVVGLSFTKQKQAEKMQEEMGVTFPVFGIKDAKDPISANELIELVGFKRGGQAMVWGGTMFLMDMDGAIQFMLVKEEVRDLSEKLAENVLL